MHALLRRARTCAATVALMWLPSTLLAAEEAAPVMAPQPALGAASLKVVGVLCLLLAVLFGGFWLLRRFGPRAGLGMLGRSDLKLEGQLALGPKKSVMVVRFLNKHLVLGVTDSTINLLTEMDADDDETNTNFSKALQTASRSDR
ncbi:flagellar biosynthetic protein FliO [Desulfobaculum senezii]|jgi:flagellar protein FliO/FliZ